jgi:hypothetical protein
MLVQSPDALAVICARPGDVPWIDSLLSAVSLEIVRQNPTAAVALAESLAPGERRGRLLERIACDWAERNASAAYAWISTLEDPQLRERLIMVTGSR